MTEHEFATLLDFVRTAFESAIDAEALLQNRLLALVELPFLTDSQRQKLLAVANPPEDIALTEFNKILGVAFARWDDPNVLRAEYKGHVHFPTRAEGGWNLGAAHFASLRAIAIYLRKRYVHLD